MDIYLKVTAGILITAILSVVLSRQGKDISILLILCVCCMVVISTIAYFRPVVAFINKLIQIGRLNNQLLDLIMKVTGIGLLSQIAEFVCADAGSQSLSKTLQIITTTILVSISVPLLEEVLSLIENILGAI